MKLFSLIGLMFLCITSKAQLTVTGVLEADSFTGTGLTINGDMRGYNLVLTGSLTASSFSGTYTGTILTPAQNNITSLGVLGKLSVTNQAEIGTISTTQVSGIGVLALRETGGEYGEAGLEIYNKTGSNGPIFYTNPTNSSIDLVDFGFLSKASNSQTNIRFEHRSSSWLDPLNTNGEMQFFHITNNGATATPSTSFAAVSSAVTVFNATSGIKLNGGTGPSNFSTSGAGTLTLGGAAATGTITLGESTNTQTVNIGTGTGASTVNIATGGTNANTINIGNTVGATAVNISAGTGSSTFATTGAGTLTLGGAAATGNITLGSSSNAQTVNVGNGTGASFVNIGVNSSAPEITLGRASTAAGAGVRLGNGRFTINKPTAPSIGNNANVVLTVTQLLESGIIGFASTATRTLTMPTAAGVNGIVQNLPGTPAVGDVFSFTVFNTSAGTITLAAGTGVTISGPANIFPSAAAASRTYYCRVTSIVSGSETITCY